MKENRYKKLREDFEFTPNGYRMTADQLATIFKERGYDTLTHSAIRKIETDNRNVSEYELKGYCEVFNTTSDYLLWYQQCFYYRQRHCYDRSYDRFIRCSYTNTNLM